MECVDRLAGKNWTLDPCRWDFTESLDLNRYRAHEFLEITATHLRTKGYSLLQIEEDSDSEVFTIVSTAKATPKVQAFAKQGLVASEVEGVAPKPLTTTKQARQYERDYQHALKEQSRSKSPDNWLALARLALATNCPLD
jgi:hypothetical protein